jgi:hypothetical protein
MNNMKRTPNQNMQITINDPDKPRRRYGASELALQISRNKRKAELLREKRELEAACKEVWDE